MSKSEDADASGSFMRTQHFYFLVTGIVAIIYGAMHPEQRVLGFVAGGAFVVIGGFLLTRSLRRKNSGKKGSASRS
ncbi:MULTISPECIES: hypothetical protein [Clavibacter]|uniref:Integral membrane protein n=2 Tax=Clavibacter TaxID=1573 RepID=A0A399NWZ4_9MICO|nr:MULTISPECIES: hypothetical protein [Clavibacter]KDP91433.1 hypothetical protein W824_08660 [Clavibacter cf. michiganensis LMG 26808]RII98454.1 hypothetical protein DZF96_02935 [Clavibacter michiganensis]UKF25454.1 hypothetical protein KYT88_01780 [Clavibacter sp. A6099]